MVDNKSLMFLPHYLESIIDQSTINEKTVLKGKNLVKLKTPIIGSEKKFRDTYNISIYAWLSLLVTLSLLILKKETLLTYGLLLTYY